MANLVKEKLDDELDNELNDDLYLKNKYLTFNAGEEEYGIDVTYVIEIIGMQEITELPEVPKYIKGVINLRGKIIPVIDLRARIKKEEKAYNDRTCIIVVNINDLFTGIVVDIVLEVADISEECISLPPLMTTQYEQKYIKGIGRVDNKVKLILDCNKLLYQKDLEIFNQINNQGS